MSNMVQGGSRVVLGPSRTENSVYCVERVKVAKISCFTVVPYMDVGLSHHAE